MKRRPIYVSLDAINKKKIQTQYKYYKKQSSPLNCGVLSIAALLIVVITTSAVIPTVILSNRSSGASVPERGLDEILILQQVLTTNLGDDGILNANDTIIVEIIVINNSTKDDLDDLVITTTLQPLIDIDIVFTAAPQSSRLGPQAGGGKVEYTGTYVLTQQDIDEYDGGSILFESIATASTPLSAEQKTQTKNILFSDVILEPQGCSGCIFNETSASNGDCFSQTQACLNNALCIPCISAYASETQIPAACANSMDWLTLESCMCSACDPFCDPIPTAICDSVAIALDAMGMANVDVDAIAQKTLGICTGAIFSSPLSMLNCSYIGKQMIPIYVNYDGKTDSCMANVTVSDLIFPTAMCQDISIDLDMNGMANIISMNIDNGSMDNCQSQLNKIIQMENFNCSHIPASQATLVVTDLQGNSDQCVSNVMVNDLIEPTSVCNPITVPLDVMGMATLDVSTAAMFDDACGVANSMIEASSYSCPDGLLGQQDYTVSITDINTNVGTCTNTIEVIDTIDPVALCNAAIMVNLETDGSYTMSAGELDNGSFDNCGIAMSAVSPPSVSSCPVMTVVTLQVTDPSGLMDSCDTNVIFSDVTAPSLTCSDIILNIVTTVVTADVSDVATFSDNCGIATTLLEPSAFYCSDVGMGTMDFTVTVTDTNALSTQCMSNTIEIVDTIPPVAQCQDFLLSIGAGGMATLLTSDIDNGSFDNCGTPSLALNQTTFVIAEQGFKPVLLTATDASGNVDSCVAIVAVDDALTIGTLTCAANVVEGDGVYMEEYDSFPPLVLPTPSGFFAAPVITYTDAFDTYTSKKKKNKKKKDHFVFNANVTMEHMDNMEQFTSVGTVGSEMGVYVTPENITMPIDFFPFNKKKIAHQRVPTVTAIEQELELESMFGQQGSGADRWFSSDYGRQSSNEDAWVVTMAKENPYPRAWIKSIDYSAGILVLDLTQVVNPMPPLNCRLGSVSFKGNVMFDVLSERWVFALPSTVAGHICVWVSEDFYFGIPGLTVSGGVFITNSARFHIYDLDVGTANTIDFLRIATWNDVYALSTWSETGPERRICLLERSNMLIGVAPTVICVDPGINADSFAYPLVPINSKTPVASGHNDPLKAYFVDVRMSSSGFDTINTIAYETTSFTGGIPTVTNILSNLPTTNLDFDTSMCPFPDRCITDANGVPITGFSGWLTHIDYHDYGPNNVRLAFAVPHLQNQVMGWTNSAVNYYSFVGDQTDSMPPITGANVEVFDTILGGTNIALLNVGIGVNNLGQVNIGMWEFLLSGVSHSFYVYVRLRTDTQTRKTQSFQKRTNFIFLSTDFSMGPFTNIVPIQVGDTALTMRDRVFVTMYAAHQTPPVAAIINQLLRTRPITIDRTYTADNGIESNTCVQNIAFI